MKEGDQFPSFSLQDDSGATVSLESLKGSSVVLYFYPKDDTSGCTVEACEFRDSLPQFDGAGKAKVFGISPDSAASHKKFKAKFGLNFPLLADEGHSLADACGVWVEKSMYGRKYMGIERTTFLIDGTGKVVQVWRKVKPAGHAEEVLKALA